MRAFHLLSHLCHGDHGGIMFLTKEKRDALRLSIGDALCRLQDGNDRKVLLVMFALIHDLDEAESRVLTRRQDVEAGLPLSFPMGTLAELQTVLNKLLGQGRQNQSLDCEPLQ